IIIAIKAARHSRPCVTLYFGAYLPSSTWATLLEFTDHNGYNILVKQLPADAMSHQIIGATLLEIRSHGVVYRLPATAYSWTKVRSSPPATGCYGATELIYTSVLAMIGSISYYHVKIKQDVQFGHVAIGSQWNMDLLEII
ncbi:hypothetical protein K7432_012744, partial [Basidiobolus ranarum]